MFFFQLIFFHQQDTIIGTRKNRKAKTVPSISGGINYETNRKSRDALRAISYCLAMDNPAPSTFIAPRKASAGNLRSFGWHANRPAHERP